MKKVKNAVKPTTDKQNRTKMGMLADQLRRHCKTKDLRCIIFHEGDKPGTAAISGYFGDAMATSLIQHFFTWKPDLVRSAIKQIEEFAAEQPVEKTEAEPPKPLIIVP